MEVFGIQVGTVDLIPAPHLRPPKRLTDVTGVALVSCLTSDT